MPGQLEQNRRRRLLALAAAIGTSLAIAAGIHVAGSLGEHQATAAPASRPADASAKLTGFDARVIDGPLVRRARDASPPYRRAPADAPPVPPVDARPVDARPIVRPRDAGRPYVRDAQLLYRR